MLTCSECGSERKFVGSTTPTCGSCGVRIDRECKCRHAPHCEATASTIATVYRRSNYGNR